MTDKLLAREATPEMIKAVRDHLRMPNLSDSDLAAIWRTMHRAGGVEMIPLVSEAGLIRPPYARG